MKKNVSEKWLIMSCLQKSIRRGFNDLALYYTKEMMEIDREFLYYRLASIAVEDVGLGDVDLIENFLSTQLKQNEIDSRGGDEYVFRFIKVLCESVKDRSASDLTYLSSFYQDNMPDETKEKEKIFIDDDEAIVNRLLAGWEILGSQKLKNPLISNKVDSIEKFINLNKRITNNPKIISIIEHSYSLQKEPHFIALGLLSYLLEREKKKEIKIGNFLPGQYVEKNMTKKMVNSKWLIDGVDWHTKEGQLAIEEFVKVDNNVVRYLRDVGADEQSLKETIGMLLFRNRGQQVNKRMVYPSAIVIMKMNEKLTFQKLTGTTKANFNEAMNHFETDLELLDSIIDEKMNMPNPNLFPF